MHMVATASAYDDGPSAFRYPRGEGLGVDLPERGEILELGKGRILREGSKVAILSLGTRLADSLKAAAELENYGVSTTVADARFAKPIDRDLLRRLAANHEALIVVEEGSVGGFGSQVFQALSEDGMLDGVRGAFKFRSMTLPDAYIDHDKHELMIAKAMLDSTAIVGKALELLGDEKAAARVMIA
jgi:1-deoxy-D-xylulose-5-phosphate synthase